MEENMADLLIGLLWMVVVALLIREFYLAARDRYSKPVDELEPNESNEEKVFL